MRTDRASQEYIIAQWRASGLTIAAFCREIDIPPHRLRYWFRQGEVRRGFAEDSASSFGFMECRVLGAPAPAPAPADVVMSVKGCGGVVEISLRGSVSASFVSDVVREIVR